MSRDKHLMYTVKLVKLKGSTRLGRAIKAAKEALAALLPEGPDVAACILINRVVFKSVRAEFFEQWDLQAAAEAKSPRALQDYLGLTNSLRNDLNTLMAMVDRKAQPPSDPDLQEYLATLKKAAKAEVIQVERS